MVVYEILPPKLVGELKRYNDICEIRLRKDSNVCIITRNCRLQLDVMITERELFDVVLKCCNHSIYTISEQLKQGYFTYKGMRIGVTGEAVYENEKLITIKNFHSLSIRVAKEAENYPNILMKKLFGSGLKNVLIFSKVGVGKTTLIRYLAKKLSYSDKLYSIIVIDERREIFGCGEFSPCRCDVYSGISKQSGIEFAIKTMSPDLIVCDELKVLSDIEAIQEGINCGVKFIATIHAENLQDLEKKQFFKFALEKRIFDYFVQLTDKNGKGNIENIFNWEFLCC